MTSLKFQYDDIYDLISEDTKTKYDLVANAQSTTKDRKSIKFYPACLFVTIVQKLVTKGATQKL